MAVSQEPSHFASFLLVKDNEVDIVAKLDSFPGSGSIHAMKFASENVGVDGRRQACAEFLLNSFGASLSKKWVGIFCFPKYYPTVSNGRVRLLACVVGWAGVV